MLVRVAIVAQVSPELEAIRFELRNPIRFTLREFFSISEIAVGLKDFQCQVLILRIDHFRESNVAMLVKIRVSFPQIAVILIAASIEPSARYQVRAMSGVKLIAEDKELSDLSLMVEKFARGDDHPLRLHARVRRDGAAEIFKPKDNLKFTAKFVDFAQMGARVSINTKVPLKRNDRFQLHYESVSEPGKIHRIEAVVIWEQITSGMVGTIVKGLQQTVGLRFIAAL